MSPRCVVVIVFDSVRADHVSAYGYSRATTPTLDGMAERGVLWEQAHSASSWTKPSVGSIFTGRMPSEHGALRGVKRSRTRPAATTDALAPGLPTLAGSFRAAGWRCGAFMNNAQLAPFTRFDQGFETYLHSAGKADGIIAALEEWLAHDLGKPAFCYLHFMETHWPYRPRRRHVAIFGGDRDANHFRDYAARDYAHLRRALRHEGTNLPEDQLVQMVQMYDGAIRRLDGKLRLVLDLLERVGLRDGAMTVVTADHGEELMDHGAIGHGHTLYDELTRVPLVAHGPGLTPGARLPAPVTQAHLGRTLLDWAGIGGSFPGRSLLDERSDGPVISELHAGRSYAQAVRRDGWKLIRQSQIIECEADPPERSSLEGRNSPHMGEAGVELYSLTTDPYETANLAAHPLHVATQHGLERELERRRSSDDGFGERGSHELVEIGPEVVGRLRDLGYLD